MNRRDLLLLGGMLTAPRVLRAQQKATPVIGFLSGGSPAPFAPIVAAFHRGQRWDICGEERDLDDSDRLRQW